MTQRDGSPRRRSASGRSKKNDTRKLQIIYLIIGIIVVLSMVHTSVLR